MKGLIWTNFLYLGLFYIAYFIFVPVALYATGEICTVANDILGQNCDTAIPQSTQFAMDFFLFGLIPIAALGFTIMASRQPQQFGN